MSRFKKQREELRVRVFDGDIIPLLARKTTYSRATRREAIMEFHKNLETLLKIEKEFLDSLFSDSSLSYYPLYRVYKEIWEIRSTSMIQEYSIVNPEYFDEMYKPQV